MEHNEDEINLLDYWHVIKRKKKLICVIVGVITLIAIIYSLLAPNIYRAKVVIMPVGSGSSGGLAAMASQLSGMPFLGGLAGNDGITQRFMALLKTRTLSEDIINKFDLLKVFYKDSWDENNKGWKNPDKKPTMEAAANQLSLGRMDFLDNVELGTITIFAEFSDPQLAAKVANGYVAGLQEIMNKNSFTSEKRNRVFVAGQLEQNKKELLEMGIEINEFYKEDKVSNIDSRVDVILASPDPAWEDLENSKNELKEKLQAANVVKGVPQQVYLQYLMLRRELLGKMNALLTQQYEMAKIEEAREDLAFQVIDPARVPETRFEPKRRQIVMMSFIASLFLAIFFVFILEYIEKMTGSKVTIKIPFWRRITL